MTNTWNYFLWILVAFALFFSKGSVHMSEPINFSYFLHFFDVLLLQSLQKLALSLTSIPAVLQASSLLPLDPPSRGSVALSFPNVLLMRPSLCFHTQTHIHVLDVPRARLRPISCQGGVPDTCGFGAKSPPHLSELYTFHSLPLRLSLSPALLHSTFLSGDTRINVPMGLKPLESGTETQITSRGHTDRMDTVTQCRRPFSKPFPFSPVVCTSQPTSSRCYGLKL